MDTVRTVVDLRARIAAWRRDGASVGLVPTMGGLHEGHLSLIRLAANRADKVVATLFVNPAQFAPNEDFSAYPRDETADRDRFASAGAALLFAPEIGEIYPDGHATRVEVQGLSHVLEGEFRPHFFTGVATVVSKLLIQAMADVAVFGEKDFQQLQVIRRMARDLDIPTEILGGPTVRDADGLALSSRNAYLSNAERAVAPALHAAIGDVAAAVRSADGAEAEAVCRTAATGLIEAGFREVDYISVRDATTLEPVSDHTRPARVLAAAWLGKTRLIDNIAV